ncbi:MAG: MMPL family transporter [Cytophagales bacterium]|nr:MMPL family transporter [Cytophagales bacterium]
MWNSLAHIILKYRLLLVILLGIITVFMAYQAQFIKWSYSLQNIVPDSNKEMIYFKNFKKTYGEDGNVLVLAFQDSSVYQVENFRNLSYLVRELEKLDGVDAVLGLPNLQILSKNTQEKKFDFKPLFGDIPSEQTALDSLLQIARDQRLYSGQLSNPENGASLLVVSISAKVLNSKSRDVTVPDIIRAAEAFEKASKIDLKYSGLPFVRYVNRTKVKAELNLFLIISVLITGVILFLFFRSFKAVIFPLIIIGVVVVWVLGTISLFGFEITLLTGLIPPIIVVIGIPNSVYMLNKYHNEYMTHGDKKKALTQIIRKIGIVTFITNMTTAVGFFVLISTSIQVLVEFGTVAGINILATFVVSIILIPVAFSYVDPPSPKHLKHLKFRLLNGVLSGLDVAVHRHKTIIFILTALVIGASLHGASNIKAVSYMLDDLPAKSELRQDMEFLESNFGGIMPLEIIVDTGQKKGVQNLNNLRKIGALETFLDSIEYMSIPISPLSFVKASRQAYYNGRSGFYGLPTARDRAFILRYLQGNEESADLISAFVDSTGQYVRVSVKMADIGSVKMDSLVHGIIKPKISSLFEGTNLAAEVTGTTYIYIKGNEYLIRNLITSMIMAFFIIAIIMGALFRNGKMLLISIIPNVIPLMITAGIMGYFGIPLKPSTALIFSIAFGISVDNSIHFLAKYRQELFANNFNVDIAVSNSLKETGASIIYTSIILFFGFVIFAASEFGGTVNLGKLTSITLLFAMFANLAVLPALLLQFDSGKRNKDSHPLIERYEESSEGANDDKI